MSTDISKIDPNFKVTTSLTEADIQFFDVRNEPFKGYGLYEFSEGEQFRRLPEEVAKVTSDGVYDLHTNTAGGRVRFKTDSKYIVIKSVMSNVCNFAHMTLLGTSGFDIYENKNNRSSYIKSFIPPTDLKNGYESIIYFDTNEIRDLTINFPLYNNLDSLYIGIQNSAILERGEEYIYQKPVLFYGSSITQGGCASRPGNCYQNIISRKLDCDYINLGFSGNGKAEEAIVSYMSSLDISVFVCDYDHNAPTVEYLEQTHGRMYDMIRGEHPNTPIIMISKPDFKDCNNDDHKRRSVIFETFQNAINNGDHNVYFIDGETLFGEDNRDCCTVDGCHPNDLGFERMAKVIGSVLEEILNKPKSNS